VPACQTVSKHFLADKAELAAMNLSYPSPHRTALRTPMTAMILAAGRGERMRPLTDTTPKPLLTVHGKPLMQWPMEALARGGFASVVVNTAWLGDRIAEKFGNVFALQPPSNMRKQLSNQEHIPASVQIAYSHEGHDFGGALETAGGIARALPLLGDAFWVLAGDVYAPDFVFSQAAVNRFVASDKLAHLWLVPNPEHNLRGDFGLGPTGPNAVGLALSLPTDDPQPRYTYSTIGLYRAALFCPPWCDIPTGNPQGIKAPLAPLLRAAMAHQQVSAEIYTGSWTDVGTPQRLAQINA
jgi:MurNAc alpha-1-phosphate uridylyltransferase